MLVLLWDKRLRQNRDGHREKQNDSLGESPVTAPTPNGFVETAAALPGIGRLFARTAGGETVLGFAVSAVHFGAMGRLLPALQSAYAAHTGDVFVRRQVAPDAPPELVSLTSAFINAAEEGQWVEAAAGLVRRTRSLVFARVEIRAHGRTVMTADGIWQAAPGARAERAG